jgi:hypothetical protein
VDIKSNKAKFDDCAMDNFDPGNTESSRVKINIDKLTPDKCFQKFLRRNDKPISANQNKVFGGNKPAFR